MAAPTFKKATDSDAGDSTKYGAPDVKYAFDVLDGTHGTDRVQASNIETTGASDVQTDLDDKASKTASNVFTTEPQVAGDGTYTKTNPSFVADGTYTTAANGRGFLNEKSINATGSIGYAQFDAAGKTTGTNNYDHVVGYQSRPEHNSSGTISRLTGFHTDLKHNGGTITDATSYEVRDVTNTSGTITNNYGIYVKEKLSTGTKNYAFYSVTGNNHRLGGTVNIEGNDTDPPSLTVGSYRSSATTGANIFADRARGTIASPTAAQSGDRIAFYGGRGYGTTSFGSLAAMLIEATENQTDAAHGGQIVFATVPNGSTTLTDRLTIGQDGSFDFSSGNMNNCVLVSPALGTPASGALTNCTSIPAGQLTGTVADARLSSNVPLLDATQIFTGVCRFYYPHEANVMQIERQVNASLTNPITSLLLSAKTLGNAGDGFGPVMHFGFEDDTVTETFIGGIRYRRNGSDTAFDYEVLGYNNSVRMQIDPNGAVDWPQGGNHTNFVYDEDGTGNSITNLADANIKAGAAIASSKLATVEIAQGGSGQTTQQAAIDALTAVSGATNEHVLTKDTASGNAIWKASAAGTTFSGLTDTTITTPAKGDLAVYTGSSWINVGVGTNDQVLTADSAQASGVKWAAASGGDTVVGTQTKFISAAAMYPGGSNPATGPVVKQFGANNQPIQCIEFPEGTNTEAYIQDVLDNWDAGTIKVKAYWFVENDDDPPESLTFELDISGVSLGNFEAIGGTAYGTPQTITDTTDSSAAEDKMNISSPTSDITIAGAAEGEWISLKMLRDQATDTFEGSVYLAGVSIEYTIAAGTSTI